MKFIAASKFYYPRAGLESYLFKLKDILEKNGHVFIPFSTRHPKTVKNQYIDYFVEYFDLSGEKELNFFQKIKAVSNIFYNFEAQKNISNLINKEKPDIFIGFGLHRHLSPSVLVAAKKHSIPVIHRLSDYALICPASSLIKGDCSNCSDLLCPAKGCFNAIKHGCVRQSAKDNKLKKTSLKASFIGALELSFHKNLNLYQKNVDKFIAPSNFLKNIMIKSGFDEKKIIHVPTFIDHNEYIPEFNSYGYIVYAGRLAYEKGLNILLKSMEKLKKTKLLIIGDGPQKQELEKEIEQKKLKNVNLVGKLQGIELKNAIRNSIAVVVPSIWFDNSPNIIIEAFALGKPVIGSNMGGIPEYIDNEKDGFIYQHNDENQLCEKIKELTSNPLLAREFGINGRNKAVEKYNPSIHYENISKVIKEVKK
ncbi:MAG: glycosyltransferase family 4 protein [Candidatus Gastranaerophilales bacterium]|nr:glycosyltransferase family 4 protein [Candidatus Gastranaerophilales bacterium]